MKINNISKPTAVMAAIFPLLTFNITAFANEKLINEPPHRIYHALKDQTLTEAAKQIAYRSGIDFKINAANQNDTINKKLAAEDWKTALTQLLQGYNYSTEMIKGEIKNVIITGENGSGKTQADFVLIKRNGAVSSTTLEHYKNFKPGSVMPLNLPLAAMRATPVGKKLTLDLPIGQYRINHDNFVKHEDGSSTWVGYLDDEGKGYRFYLSEGKAGLMGNMYTPDGVYNIDTIDGKTVLVDLNNSGLQSAGYENDQVAATDSPAFFPTPDLFIPNLNPSAAALASQSISNNAKNSEGGAFSKNTGPIVDLMVLYTTARQSAEYAKHRIQYLVDISNQAYYDSKIHLRLRLVHTHRTSYTESINNNFGLSDLAGNYGVFKGIEALRNQYGADLVMLFRPLYANTSGSCGMTYVGFAYGSAANSRMAYGTISDGYSKDARVNSYCDTSTFSHEIGHSFGNVHDREYSSFAGKFPYSYAWGIEGSFGTIMSYKSPSLMLFSNPNLPTQCKGSPCGYPEGKANSSDQAKTTNATAVAVSHYRPTKVINPVIQ